MSLGHWSLVIRSLVIRSLVIRSLGHWSLVIRSFVLFVKCGGFCFLPLKLKDTKRILKLIISTQTKLITFGEGFAVVYLLLRNLHIVRYLHKCVNNIK